MRERLLPLLQREYHQLSAPGRLRLLCDGRRTRAMQAVTSSGTLTVDVLRCWFSITNPTAATNATAECVYAQASPARFFDCVFEAIDTVNTAWSGSGWSLVYQMVDSDNPNEFYGCHWLTKFASLPTPTASQFLTISNTALNKIGAGNTLQVQYGDFTTPYSMLSAPNAPASVWPLTVTSSAVTPNVQDNRTNSEVAADAGSLSSNTLTVNAATGQTSDGTAFRLRVKNTNSGSTAMTLSFNSAYNNAGFSVTTIAAGKRAYFDFTYDADNAKWDLTGYVNGL